MPLEKIIADLQRLDELTRRRQTGTPKELAKKFGISSRTLYRRIEFLRQFRCAYCL
jgi:predicted DNA-binding transcriptional regulator YafY